MNHLVKILSDDNGEARENHLQYWHYIDTVCGDPCTLCESEFFGLGQSGCEYEVKQTKRGGITCPTCLRRINIIKAIKL